MVGYELILRIKDEQGHLHEVVHKTGGDGNGETSEPKRPNIDVEAINQGIVHNPQQQQAVADNAKHLQRELERTNERSKDLSKQLDRAYKAIGNVLTELGVYNEELKKKDLDAQIQEAFRLQQDNQKALKRAQDGLNTLAQELASELEMEDWEEKDDMANKKRKLKDKIRKLKEECKEWKDKAGKVSKLEGDLEREKAEVRRLKRELDEHEKTIGAAKTNYDELDRQKRQAEHDRDEFQKKNKQLDIDYQTLKGERDDLQIKLDKEKQKVEDKDQEVADAQKQAESYKDFEPLKELFEIAKQGSIPSLVVRHLEEFLYEIYKDLDFTLDALAQDIADQYSKNKGDLDNPQLQEFFDTLFGLVGEKMGLERLRVQEGESYNSTLCRKLDQSMPTQGKITQVHFQGYKQKGKVKHASSVSVK
ncbi:coiled-coil domain-containing protein [Helicobacter bizzozeronii]|uniref:hypothetical protein n=1 Tax=Helicobacter bizzozeronii TaxID=56877 RepID=UPI00024E5C39|nr:hypothetical protein [Helicobacter bizzozeronii]CCF79876.1 antigen 332, putative [Helicobacter bizzozeronii CCUG 35545]